MSSLEVTSNAIFLVSYYWIKLDSPEFINLCNYGLEGKLVCDPALLLGPAIGNLSLSSTRGQAFSFGLGFANNFL